MSATISDESSVPRAPPPHCGVPACSLHLWSNFSPSYSRKNTVPYGPAYSSMRKTSGISSTSKLGSYLSRIAGRRQAQTRNSFAVAAGFGCSIVCTIGRLAVLGTRQEGETGVLPFFRVLCKRAGARPRVALVEVPFSVPRAANSLGVLRLRRTIRERIAWLRSGGQYERSDPYFPTPSPTAGGSVFCSSAATRSIWRIARR